MLVVATTYHQTWAVAGYEARQDNAIQRVAQFTIRRGLIYAADGRTVLAANRARKVDGKTFYFRRYPEGPLAANVVGYSTQARSRTGLERSLNDYLTASNANLRTVLDKTIDKLTGATVEGNNVVTTLRPGAQRLAEQALGSNCGAAVALDPKTGAVLVMATSPRYNPSRIEHDFAHAQASYGNCRPQSPLLNRATNGLYPPGSTFKIVTAAAALDSGKATITTTFDDPGYCVEYGKKVSNYETNRPFGHVTFKEALQHSINSVFCNLGKELGARQLVAKARDFGFYKRPPLETPADERAPSGLYDFKRHVPFAPKADNEVDAGRFAFGQERLLVSPLQMAMVSAAVANGGVLMKPFLVRRIASPDGKVVERTRPQVYRRAMKPESAAALKEMMEAVVAAGTGTAARIPGVRVAGKTGTAETGVSRRNTTAFICFAPVEDPRVAVAVMLENQSGVGGTTAAPVARRIMKALLPPGSKA